MDLTPKQQASEAIRQAEAILIVTGQRPNVDQVSSVVALSLILRKFGKKVTTLISDQVPSSANFMAQDQVEKNLTGLRDFIVKVDLSHAEVDKLKYTVENGKLNVHITPFKGGFNQQDVSFGHGDYHYDLVIALGVASRAKLDRIVEQNPILLQSTPLLNLDFHRINESYGAINLVDTNAATLSEMLISLAESLQAGLLDEQIATAMLTGIIAATDRFSAPHTTAKSMTVAAQLMAAGAKQQQIIKSLYGGGQRDDRERRDDRSQRDSRDRDRDRQADRPSPAQTTSTAVSSPQVSTSLPVQAPNPVVSTPQPVVNSSPTQAYPPPEPATPLPEFVRPQESEPDNIDTGPNLAALDWNGILPTLPGSLVHEPSVFSAPQAEPVDTNHQMQAGVTSDLPNEGEASVPPETNLNADHS